MKTKFITLIIAIALMASDVVAGNFFFTALPKDAEDIVDVEFDAESFEVEVDFVGIDENFVKLDGVYYHAGGFFIHWKEGSIGDKDYYVILYTNDGEVEYKLEDTRDVEFHLNEVIIKHRDTNLPNTEYSYEICTRARYELRSANGIEDVGKLPPQVTLNNGTLSISAEAPIGQVNIFDLSGKVVQSFCVSDNSYVGSFIFQPGMYIIKTENETKKVINK